MTRRLSDAVLAVAVTAAGVAAAITLAADDLAGRLDPRRWR